MSRRWVPRKIDSSIFLKLLFMFVSVSAVTIIVLYFVIDILIPSPDRELAFRFRNRVHYAELLINEMGVPPDTNRVGHVARDEGFSVVIDSLSSAPGTLNFKTNPSDPSIDFVREHAIKSFHVDNAYTGLAWKRIFLIMDRGPYRYLFLFPYDPLLRVRPGVTSIITGLVLLLLLATYLFTRRLLRPLKELHEGVLEISEGHLSYRIPATQSDEFGVLARSFNQMSDRIQEMIQAKEQLMLDVSHELRSPLTRVSVALEVGGSEEIIRKNLREMDAMITELLESARLASTNGALRVEKIELAQLVREMASKYESELPGVKVIDFPQGIDLTVDPARIHTVFKNVIENAIKYSPKDRKPVEISVRALSAESVEVRVRDFGVGISEKEQKLVFEPFYRVDKSRCKETGGYGLGLSLSRKIMLAHAGDLRLESVLGEGTSVFVTFRRA